MRQRIFTESPQLTIKRSGVKCTGIGLTTTCSVGLCLVFTTMHLKLALLYGQKYLSDLTYRFTMNHQCTGVLLRVIKLRHYGFSVAL